MELIWLGAMVALCVLEAVTIAMICIWYAGGALVALFAAMLGASVPAQIIICLAVGTVLMLVFRKWVIAKVNTRRERTNSDRVIGELAFVTEAIDNRQGIGAVKVQGKEWSARADSGEAIEKDVQVKILRIEGVRLWVERPAQP